MKKSRLVRVLGIGSSKYYDWKKRYGKDNRHNGRVPRDFWLQPWERDAIIAFYWDHSDEGYRPLTYMMMDQDIVAVSPSTVLRVLKQAGCIGAATLKPSLKGTGFVQPQHPHAHWHIDVSYLNMNGTFYYMCFILDGYSRSIVHWDIRESMKESDIECIIERASELYPGHQTRIISDNGPQFIARDFKSYIRLKGMDHVRTSPYYPQSNGKIERLHQSVKKECIRVKSPLDLADAKQVVAAYVEHYNTRRLHAGVGYVTPHDKLNGHASRIHRERDRKLAAARAKRKAAA